MHGEYLLLLVALEILILTQNPLALLLLNAEGRFLIFFQEMLTFSMAPDENFVGDFWLFEVLFGLFCLNQYIFLTLITE